MVKEQPAENMPNQTNSRFSTFLIQARGCTQTCARKDTVQLSTPGKSEKCKESMYYKKISDGDIGYRTCQESSGVYKTKINVSVS
jgi:hypothetical protein